jgi:hypothetical protein
MKKVFALIAVIALALAPVAFATDETELTPNGVSQGTLVRYLSNLQATVNELAADHDADNAAVAELIADHDADNNEFALAVTELTELKADHDADNNEFALAVTELTELKADHDADNDVHAEVKTAVNAVLAGYNSSLVQIGTIAISGAAAEKFKTTTPAIAVVRGATISKTSTDNLTFTAADTINTAAGAGDFWGAWKVEIGLDGTIYTNSVSADQVYADEAAAIAALPATTTGRAFLGYITVEANNGADWVANTDDLTVASDCQAANFYDNAVVADVAVVAGTVAADLTAVTPTGFAADLTAANPTGFAADLTANTQAADLSSDSVIGSGTVTDPKVSLVD